MAADHVHKRLQQPYRDLIGAVVIVAIAREVAFGLEAEREARFVADDVHLGVLDGADGVYHMAKACDTRSERATHIGVDQCQLSGLVEVFVVHVVDHIQRVHIHASQPLHHIHEARHKLVVLHHVALDRTESRAALLACLGVYTATDSVRKTLSQVSSRAEELHLLARLRGRHTAADRVIVAPDRPHHVVVFVLDGAGRHRDLRCVTLETFWQTR